MAQQTAWQAAKQLAQSAFSDVANTYQQVLLTGHLYPSNSDMNREIAEASYDRREPEPVADVERSGQERQALEIEPER